MLKEVGLEINIEKTKYMLLLSCHHKQTPWPLVRKRTIPTERPPLVDEILVTTVQVKITT
jgi:hypothetical protein